MENSPFNPLQQASNIDYKLVYAFERVSQIFRTLLWQVQVETGLSPIQSQILIFMFFHEDKYISISSFAVEFSVTKATISDAFKTLEKKGLVRKEQDLIDKRRQNLKLTQDGILLAEKISVYTSPFDEVLNSFSIERKENLFDLMGELIVNLNKKNLISPLRMCKSCHYFERKDEKNYCNLVKAFLKNEDLRLDCPEHLV